ncbi:Hypothetical predicted protein [Paramuricea clavata]|uniref:Uncharacterized protein n=1 Tax=Paramuricea clavata TaxID=317549 RepID=A0A7D9DCV4_PARCT|nr:Hypothetical predicted protein [Paramuricea clavata]
MYQRCLDCWGIKIKQNVPNIFIPEDSYPNEVDDPFGNDAKHRMSLLYGVAMKKRMPYHDGNPRDGPDRRYECIDELVDRVFIKEGNTDDEETDEEEQNI